MKPPKPLPIDDSSLPKYSGTTGLIDTVTRADYVFSIADRKIRIIKSRSGKFEPGNIIRSITDLNNIITQLVINFEHPIYLPTLDEVRKHELKIEVTKLLKDVSWMRKTQIGNSEKQRLLIT